MSETQAIWLEAICAVRHSEASPAAAAAKAVFVSKQTQAGT
jgi:hypothetical protein